MRWLRTDAECQLHFDYRHTAGPVMDSTARSMPSSSLRYSAHVRVAVIHRTHAAFIADSEAT